MNPNIALLKEYALRLSDHVDIFSRTQTLKHHVETLGGKVSFDFDDLGTKLLT